MKIHPGAVELFNKKATEYLGLIDRLELGPDDDIAATVRGKILVTSEEEQSTDEKVFSEEGIGIYYLINKEWIGLNNENVGKFGDLIRSIHQKKEVNPLVSFYRLKDICLSWLINTYLGREDRSLIQTIEDTVEREIGNYQIFYRIENLKISKGFYIGPIWFGFFEGEELETTLYFLDKDKHDSLIRTAKKRFENITIVTYTVGGVEITKAREITSMLCHTSVNVLRIFSPTLFNPLIRCDFDLDFLLKGDPKSEALSIKYSGEKKPLSASLHFNRKPYEVLEIDDEYLAFMNKKGLLEFHDFLSYPKDTELFELIIKTIDLFGPVLAIDDLHLRIINLFTIAEFLLLKDSGVPILDALKKYFPILISEDQAERSEIKKVLTSLYSIRSAAIHHGNYKDFQLDDLRKFQECLFRILKRLISLSKIYSTKDEILKEIDESIAGVSWKPRVI